MRYRPPCADPAGPPPTSSPVQPTNPSVHLPAHPPMLPAPPRPASPRPALCRQVRRWDAETCANTDTYNGSKAVLAVACTAHGATGSSGGGHVVAFAGSDRAVRLWDCRGRTRGEELGVRALGSHAGWVASLAWCPGSEHRLASSSYDGSVRVWDTRAGGVPLASLPDCHDGHKVLCVAWERDSGALLSGGADCRLRRFEFDSKVGGLIAGKAAAGR